jgi:hypothetical protein
MNIVLLNIKTRRRQFEKKLKKEGQLSLLRVTSASVGLIIPTWGGYFIFQPPQKYLIMKRIE